MINHWDKNLNTKALIERFNPQLVVEAGCGASTRLLRALKQERGFRLVCIDVMDDPEHPGSMGLTPGVITHKEDLELLYGISYVNLKIFEDHTIDMAIVDTDHNGWTLQQELSILEEKMRPGGVVILHDTEAFKDTNGIMEQYISGERTYPMEEILAGPTMGQVVEAYCQRWTVIAESAEASGAIAFQVE